MYFEEEIITNLLKCDHCQASLKWNGLPKTLPCGKIICDTCEWSLLLISNNSNFKCSLCNEEHSLPEKGFAISKLAASLILAKPKDFNKKKCEYFVNNLNKLESIINEFEFHCDHGIEVIRVNCDSRKISLNLNKNSVEISNDDENLFNIVETYKNVCISSHLKNKDLYKEKVNKLRDNIYKFINETEVVLDDHIILNKFIAEVERLHNKIVEQISFYTNSNLFVEQFNESIIEKKVNSLIIIKVGKKILIFF